jgi:hypothetical protein
MKIKVPYLIQGPQITRSKGIDPVEWLSLERELFCLDGPVTRRVAVLDFDPLTGTLLKGCPFVAPHNEEPGTFGLNDVNDITATDFLQVNAFATVLSTLYMFEEEDVLGREVEWAFGAPQLFVVPRAGEWANAFYQRESHSVQFFYFTGPGGPAGHTIFTALSQDIIAHETGHAILDGIAPDLYNSITPQSLALHEAVADLTALLVGLRSRRLRERLLSQTHGRIDGLNALSALAEQFGTARDTGRAAYLRSLWNEWNLDPNDRQNGVRRTDPHGLSEVLSGALYRVFARLHDEYSSARAAEEGITEFSASGWALYVAREHFKRLVLRSLDYLPPGEVCFADYGRAILASDQASYPGDSTGRSSLVEEFVRRCIVPNAAALEVRTTYDHPAVQDIDLEVLVSSEWAAYEFAERNRDFLGIPADVRFRIRPRVRATKKYRGQVDFEEVTECIFRVSWDREEDNPTDLPLPDRRQITVGTTLVIDWETRQVRVLLTSEAARPSSAANEEGRRQQHDRDEMLRHLVRTHALGFGPEHDDQPIYATAARVETSGDLMRVRSSGRMLHLTSDRYSNG